jgi:hypothetical protein
MEAIKITSVEPEVPVEQERCKLAEPVQQSPVEIPGLGEVKSLEQVLEEAPKPLEGGATDSAGKPPKKK